MKTQTFYWMLIVSLFVIALSACAAPATALPATQTPEMQPNPADDPKARIVLDMTAKLTAGDVDGSGGATAEEAVNFIDAVMLVEYLFAGGPKPLLPFDACGIADTTTDMNCPPGSIVCY